MSFNELGTAVNNAFKSVIDNIDNFDENIGFWESLKGNLFSKKKDIESQLIDVMPEINSNDISDATEEIKAMASSVSKNKATWQEWFDTLPEGKKHLAQLGQQMEGQIITTEGVTKANQAAREAAIAHNAALQQQTLGAKAATAATKALAVAGNMLLMWGISQLIRGFYELSQISEDVAKKAKEVGNAFSSTKSDIEGYKEQIKELYQTINNSGSSFEEVTTARQNLMFVQDELIDKFGTEKETIQLITEAIYGQADALDKLTEKQWQETKNNFNNGGFWNGVANFFQGTDNIERILNEYGEKTILFKWADFANPDQLTDGMVAKLENIGIDIVVSTDNLQEIRDFNSLTESIVDTKGASLSITGNAEEIYNQLLALQSLISDDDSLNKLYNKVESTANSYKDLTDNYKEFYNQYILYEKILTNNSDYVGTFKNITDSYEEYKEAFTSGDENKIKESTENYAKVLMDAISIATANGDSDVATYFEDMYPDLQSAVEGWKFNVAFDANTDDIQGKVQSILDKLKDKNGRTLTAEKILGLGEENEQYQALVAIAHTYNMSIEEMIELLKERNLVSAMDYQGLVGLFGQDNIDEIAPEDLIFAYQVKNIGDMSFEEFQKEIKRIKDESQNVNETEISFNLEDFSDNISEITSAYSTLSSAIEEYNENGAYSLDTMNKLLSLEPQYLALLVQKNGQLALNEEGLRAIVQAQLEQAQAEIYATGIAKLKALTDEQAGIASETAASKMSSSTADINAQTEAYNNNTLAAAANAAIKGGANKSDVDSIVTETEHQVKAIQNAVNGLSFDVGGVTGGFSSAGSSAKDSAEDAASTFKSLMDNELEVLDARMEAGLIKYDDYLKQRLALIESYKGKISDADYYSALSDNYENELSYMDKALNAVKRAIDKKIEAYNEEIEALEEAHDKKTQLIDNEIQKLEDQKDALQDENDAVERQLALEQSLYDLERAQTQRTKMVYTGDKGYVYTTDQDAIRDAQEAVRQSKLDIQISEIDGAIEKLQEEQEALEEKLDLEREAIEKNIEDLEEYQSKWNEITSKYSEDQETMIAAAIWGKDWENVILTDRTTALTDFTNTYMELQLSQANAALLAAEAIEEAERRKAVAEGTGTNDSNSINDTNVPSNNNAVKTGVNAAVTAAFATIDATKYPNKRYYVFDKYGNYKSAYDSELEARKYQLTSYIYDTTDKKFLSKASSNETTSSASKKIISFLLAGNKYHTGLDKGLVGKNHTSSADLETLQKYSLAQNEVPALLKLGEAVITQEQMANIAGNLRFLDVNPFEDMQLPEFNYDLIDRVQSINFSIGDINLNNVQNVDSLSDAILRELPNKVLQRIHKR